MIKFCQYEHKLPDYKKIKEKAAAVRQIPYTIHLLLHLALPSCLGHEESHNSSKLNSSSTVIAISSGGLAWYRQCTVWVMRWLSTGLVHLTRSEPKILPQKVLQASCAEFS